VWLVGAIGGHKGLPKRSQIAGTHGTNCHPFQSATVKRKTFSYISPFSVKANNTTEWSSDSGMAVIWIMRGIADGNCCGRDCEDVRAETGIMQGPPVALKRKIGVLMVRDRGEHFPLAPLLVGKVEVSGKDRPFLSQGEED
jgi:hypothetical protein